MELEDNYWEKQLNIYNNLNYYREKKYESWQPARWSANKVAVDLIEKYIDNDKLHTSIEIGAGSGAFSLELYRKYKNKIIEIDRSNNACEFGKKVAEDMNIPVEYHIMDFFDIEKENIADIVLSLGVIEHYNEDEQVMFIQKCKQLTNKYVFIAIPNQESRIFKNYVNWSNKNNNVYEEEHKLLDLNELIKKMKSQNLNILYSDGFQVFLSEGKFWSESNLEEEKIIKKLKLELKEKSSKIGNQFPSYDFTYDDIQLIDDIEYNLTRDERINNSFMSFVLASK